MTAEEKIKQDILKYINNMEIDVEDLDSYSYSAPSYSWVSSSPAPASEDWDYNEEFQAKVEWLVDAIENRGDNFGDYVPMTQDEIWDDDLQLRLLSWLKGLLD